MKTYPEHQDSRSGCKVSWLIYTQKSDATAAAQIARKQAREREQLGYDFGYQMPGSIERLADGRYEVCIP